MVSTETMPADTHTIIAPLPVLAYTPEQAAEMLQCTESWLKEQARQRKIPFTMLGRSYRFTADHLIQIMHIMEQRPSSSQLAERAPRTRPSRKAAPAASESGIERLHARIPKGLAS